MKKKVNPFLLMPELPEQLSLQDLGDLGRQAAETIDQIPEDLDDPEFDNDLADAYGIRKDGR